MRGAGSNDWMVEIVWHRRETRRQQRRQISTCTTRRTRSTHQKLALHLCLSCLPGLSGLFSSIIGKTP